MKKSILLGIAAFGVLSVGLLTTSKAFADTRGFGNGGYGAGIGGGFGRMLEVKSEMLNMSVEELRAEMENKTFLEIAEEKGVSREEFQSKMNEQVRARGEERGISEEQIAEREARRSERRANCPLQ